jgi:hypothetical protein
MASDDENVSFKKASAVRKGDIVLLKGTHIIIITLALVITAPARLHSSHRTKLTVRAV